MDVVLDRGGGQALFVAAHGAGSHRDHRSMLELSRVLCARGFDVLRFNFAYRERGAKLPDRMPQLQERLAAVVAQARADLGSRKLIVGGRSMGGRVASMLTAEGLACDGLLLFAYPLHPAGKPEKLRHAHLPKIGVPVLCINGSRDALCDRVLMERAIANLGWDMQWLDGKDHAYAVTGEIGDLAARWLAGLP